MRTEMTLEEATKYDRNWWEEYQIASFTENEKRDLINRALKTWNYHLDWWIISKEATMRDLKEGLMEGDNIDSLDIRFEKKEDFAARQGDEIKFNAWSERYVYVRGEYDGGTWVVAIERNPSDNLVEPIGGG